MGSRLSGKPYLARRAKSRKRGKKEEARYLSIIMTLEKLEWELHTVLGGREVPDEACRHSGIK